MLKKLFILLSALIGFYGAFAQQDIKTSPMRIWGQLSVGKNDYVGPDSCAWLDLGRPGGKRGILLPWGSKDSIYGTKKAALVIYNNQDSSAYIFDGHNWNKFLTDRDTAYLTANDIVSGYVTGTTSKIIVLNKSDGDTLHINFTDLTGGGSDFDTTYLYHYIDSLFSLALTTETDPVFSAHVSFGITGTLITHWNDAYSWGNHAGLYALLSGSYSDPSWITGLNWSKILSPPTTLFGYGITNAYRSTQVDSLFASDTLGYRWSAMTMTASKKWDAVGYGVGKFVALDYDGAVSYSYDGVNWFAGSVTGTAISKLTGVAYGNGMFVAASENSTSTLTRYATSTDGKTWTSRQAQGLGIPGSQSVVFGDNKFIMVGGSRINYSYDGITWDTVTRPSSVGFVSVCYSPQIHLFVTVAGSAGTQTKVATSSNGLSWTLRSYPEENTWTSVCWANGLFVAVASSGTNRIMTSPDGVTWTAVAAPEANSWTAVTYCNGVYIAVASTGTNRVMTSIDGATWVARMATAATAWGCIACGNSKVVVGTNGASTNTLMQSGIVKGYGLNAVTRVNNVSDADIIVPKDTFSTSWKDNMEVPVKHDVYSQHEIDSINTATALAGKAASSHTHAITDVVHLRDTLNKRWINGYVTGTTSKTIILTDINGDTTHIDFTDAGGGAGGDVYLANTQLFTGFNSFTAGFATTSYQSITSGSSATISNAKTTVIFDPASDLGTYTLTLPASPTDGQWIYISAGGTVAAGNAVVSSFTLSPNSGQAIYTSITPTQLFGGDEMAFQYQSSNTTWKRKK